MVELNGDDDSTAGEDVSLDGALAALSNPARRHALSAIADREGLVPLLELAWAVASRLHDVDRAGVSRDTLERIRLRLHHVHLPKLDAAGLVTYDPGRRVATLAAEPATVSHLLSDARAED